MRRRETQLGWGGQGYSGARAEVADPSAMRLLSTRILYDRLWIDSMLLWLHGSPSAWPTHHHPRLLHPTPGTARRQPKPSAQPRIVAAHPHAGQCFARRQDLLPAHQPVQKRRPTSNKKETCVDALCHPGARTREGPGRAGVRPECGQCRPCAIAGRCAAWPWIALKTQAPLCRLAPL